MEEILEFFVIDLNFVQGDMMKGHRIDMLGKFFEPGRRRPPATENRGGEVARFRLAREWVGLSAVLMLICLVLTATHLLSRFDQAFFDLVPQPAHRGTARPLALIVVDARTTARLGPWPFDRETRMKMLDRLTDSGVTVIGIDLMSLRESNPVRIGGDVHAAGMARSDKVGNPSSIHQAGADSSGASRVRAASGCGKRYERYSYIDVLEGRVSPERLKGRPVLIRALAGETGLGSAWPVNGVRLGGTPDMRLVSAMPRSPGFASELLFNELVVCLVCALLYRLGPGAGLLVSLGISVAIAVLAAVLFCCADRLLPPATAVLICAAACLLWSWRRLEALLRFIVLMADRLAAEPALPGKPMPERHGVDPVERQLSRAADLDERVRSYRELIDEWVDSLPEATLIASTGGTVLLANERLAALYGEPGANPVSNGVPAGRSVSDVLFQITASHRANEFAEQALASLKPWPEGENLSAQTKSQLGQGIEIANARGGLSLLIKCAPIRPASYGEGALVFHVADVSSVRMAERQRDMALRFLSHDMRSPQASILALVSQVQRDPSRHTPQRFAELVSQYATRALSLSDDFLFLAKAENLPPKLASVDPALVLGDAVDDLLPQASARSTIVNLMAEPGLSTIADVQLLRRAFVNLIGNAIKFGRESSTVDVELSATEQHVKIAVTDYGKGISELDQAKLFREFTQLDGSSSLSGHGLGLAFVKTVVDSLGGKLQVRSKLGEGTTFLMLLSKHEHDAALGG
ncbi:ATP-binding protein [Burkholderia gladioli]|uniref:ATP-binding protein n=1 Tax=Burkholderia gladioli TaxID=28095 RepID=UPI001FC7E314|nr:ATP-binding protein [Burkholderia gladioli]